MPRPSRRITCATLTAITIAAGLACRLAPLHLPFLLYKYAGSALWAIAIYWLFATLLPHTPSLRLALLTALTATVIEAFKLYNPPTLNSFRDTLPGKLLLGRYFSLTDLAVYSLAITLTTLADHLLRRKQAETL